MTEVVERHRKQTSRREFERTWRMWEAKNNDHERRIYVPERAIDRFYIKWNFEKQPSLFVNAVRTGFKRRE